MRSGFILIALIALLAALALAWNGGHTAGAAGCARARAADRAAQDAHWQQVVAQKTAQAAALTQALTTAQAQRTHVYKEVKRALPATTTGQPCLGPDALRLLDRLTPAAARLPDPAGRSADQGAAVASDTQIAQWAADVTEQHERERARCNALIDWHTAEKGSPENGSGSISQAKLEPDPFSGHTENTEKDAP